MMGEFQQHPDGYVVIRKDDDTYRATPEDFAADFAVTLPLLPEGANEQIYTQDRRHAFMGGGNVVAGGPMPWPDGDAVIANIAVGMQAMAQRESDLIAEQQKENEARQAQADAEKQSTDQKISETLSRLSQEIAALRQEIDLIRTHLVL